MNFIVYQNPGISKDMDFSFEKNYTNATVDQMQLQYRNLRVIMQLKHVIKTQRTSYASNIFTSDDIPF